MKNLKKITSIISAMLLIALFVYVICMKLYPDETSNVVGFRTYTVLSNSMEPKIPTYSLVFSKVINKDDTIKENDIITFKANRFGENLLFTHYFRKIEVDEEGNTYYLTQGATAKDYDDYQISRSDIIGKYLFHIPYLGKIFLFMQSKFGFLLYAELLVILLINKTILVRLEEKERDKEKEEEKPVLIINEPIQVKANDEIDKKKEVIETLPTYPLASYEISENLTAVYGQTLADVQLMEQHLSWVNPTQLVQIGIHTYKAFYVPRHSANIGIASEVDVVVNTEKAVPLFTIPTKMVARYGSYLYELLLPRNFVWEDDQIKIKPGVHKYNAVYIPEDNEHYTSVRVSIRVEAPLDLKVDPQFYLQGWDSEMHIHCALPLSELVKIQIDDITLDEMDYFLDEKAGIVISIRCFKTLSSNKHKIKLCFQDYLVETTFHII